MSAPYSLADENAVVGRSAHSGAGETAPPEGPGSPSDEHSAPPPCAFAAATRHIEYCASGSSTTGARIESLPTSACHHWWASSWSSVSAAPPGPASRPSIHTTPGHSMPPASGPSEIATTSISDHGYGPYGSASTWRSP